MKTQLKLYLLAGVLVIFSACERVNYYLSEDAKKFSGFKPGSYWIIQNDSTLAIDSIYATSSNSMYDTRYGDGKIWEADEMLDCYIISSQNKYFNIYIEATARSKQYTSLSYRFASGTTDIKIHNIQTTIKETPGGCELVNYHATYPQLTDSYDHLDVNGVTYHNVSRFYIAYGNATTLIDSGSVLIAQNVGPIKWTVFGTDGSSERWSVVSAHIVF